MRQERDEDAPTRYHVEYSDAAREELETIYFWQSGAYSLRMATRWSEGIRAFVEGLKQNPKRFQRASEYNESVGDVRRLLYTGYRVVYLVIDPDADEETGIVRVLHIYHGARNTH